MLRTRLAALARVLDPRTNAGSTRIPRYIQGVDNFAGTAGEAGLGATAGLSGVDGLFGAAGRDHRLNQDFPGSSGRIDRLAPALRWLGCLTTDSLVNRDIGELLLKWSHQDGDRCNFPI